MANEALVQAVKRIVGVAKHDGLDAGYAGYKDLFGTAAFTSAAPQDQRQVLKLMILAKGVPSRPTPAMMEAHRAAIPTLTELVSVHQDPADHELLGVCHVVLGNEAGASAIFRAGLAIERERNPQSDLCGALMKRVSLI